MRALHKMRFSQTRAAGAARPQEGAVSGRRNRPLGAIVPLSTCPSCPSCPGTGTNATIKLALWGGPRSAQVTHKRPTTGFLSAAGWGEGILCRTGSPHGSKLLIRLDDIAFQPTHKRPILGQFWEPWERGVQPFWPRRGQGGGWRGPGTPEDGVATAGGSRASAGGPVGAGLTSAPVEPAHRAHA